MNNQVLLNWNDYYSQKDWFDAKTPEPKINHSNSIQIKFNEIPVYCSIWEQLSGKTHSAYLYNPTWIIELINLKD